MNAMIAVFLGVFLQDRLEATAVGATPNVHRLGRVHVSGQPKGEDFALFKKAGVQVVLDLRPDAETPGFDEKALATAAGLEYVNIPVKGPADLTDEAFEKARALLRSKDKPVLLHCASANRTGAFWIAWRTLDGGIPLEDAVAEAKKTGLRTPAFEARAREYVAARAGK